LKIDSSFHYLTDHWIDLSEFEESSLLDGSTGILSQRDLRCDDASSLTVKSKGRLKSMETLQTEIENQLNLFHSCILAPIGFIMPSNSFLSGKLKIVQLYTEGNSLPEVISMNPVWWTATTKAKTCARIILSLRPAHSLG
jgi:hypothetical protein